MDFFSKRNGSWGRVIPSTKVDSSFKSVGMTPRLADRWAEDAFQSEFILEIQASTPTEVTLSETALEGFWGDPVRYVRLDTNQELVKGYYSVTFPAGNYLVKVMMSKVVTNTYQDSPYFNSNDVIKRIVDITKYRGGSFPRTSSTILVGVPATLPRSIRSLRGAFFMAPMFNQPLPNWDTSAVNEMRFMFYGASGYNQPLAHFDTSNVENMTQMFYNATAFNQDISNWNVNKVTAWSNFAFGSSLSQAKTPPKFR